MKNFLIILTLLLIVSCGGALQNFKSNYNVEEQYDKFDNVHRYIMKENILDGGYQGYQTLDATALNIRVDAFQIDTLYYLRLINVANDWLFIQKDYPLTILIDNNKVELYCDNIESEVVNPTFLGKSQGVYCKEVATYSVDKYLILQMCNAKNIELKVVGSKYYVVRTFNESNFYNFKKFVGVYIK